MERVTKLFPDLSVQQIEQLGQLPDLYADWNQKVNLVSRKDIENIFEHHVFHSLTIASFYPLSKGSLVMDLGTGGGFPGIPLAILYPEVEFHLVDSIEKKIKVVQDISQVLGLKNVKAFTQRAEKMKGPYDLVVTRAVAEMKLLYMWTNKNINWKSKHKPNGIIALKGGDQIHDELKQLPGFIKKDIREISDLTDNPYFCGKFCIHVHT